MSRHLYGPFLALADLPDLDVLTASTDEVLERMSLVCEVLEADGCLPSGTVGGRVRDPAFGADICELVMRTAPHEIRHAGGIVETVKVRLDSLCCEVDENHEIMCWIYSES